jgi:hypothetical protein
MRLVVVAFVSVVLFFPAFWLFQSVFGANWGAGIASFGMYIAFPIVALRAWPTKVKAGLPSMSRALAAGELAEMDFDVSAAVALEESEDEGLHYFLQVAEDRTLFLSGQYLYEPVDAGRFPSTKIRLYWHRTAGITYGVQCLGTPLPPLSTVTASTDIGMERADRPEDRQVLEQSLPSAVARHVPQSETPLR